MKGPVKEPHITTHEPSYSKAKRPTERRSEQRRFPGAGESRRSVERLGLGSIGFRVQGFMVSYLGLRFIGLRVDFFDFEFMV